MKKTPEKPELSEKINRQSIPSKFIVIDFEWNQPVPWLHARISYKELPGEIIEIGAVKLIKENGKYIVSESFRRFVRPVYYTIMNKNVSAIVQRNSAALKHGLRFHEAYEEFLGWCGSDFVLCSWSYSDIPILKANLKLHKMNHHLGRLFLDVQPLFSLIAEESNKQRSVEFAVDYFGFPKKRTFHEAKEDAYYTGLILKALLEKIAENEEDADKHQKKKFSHVLWDHMMNPDLKAETVQETGLFSTWEKCFSKTSRKVPRCPECQRTLTARIEWFRLKKSAFSLWFCAEHRLISGRMRLKKTPNKKVYASVRFKLDGPVGERVVLEKKAEYEIYGAEGKPFVAPAELKN